MECPLLLSRGVSVSRGSNPTRSATSRGCLALLYRLASLHVLPRRIIGSGQRIQFVRLEKRCVFRPILGLTFLLWPGRVCDAANDLVCCYTAKSLTSFSAI